MKRVFLGFESYKQKKRGAPLVVQWSNYGLLFWVVVSHRFFFAGPTSRQDRQPTVGEQAQNRVMPTLALAVPSFGLNNKKRNWS